MKIKTCPECQKAKSAIHFSGDRTQVDGLCRICRDCYSEFNKIRSKIRKFSGETMRKVHSYLRPIDSL